MLVRGGSEPAANEVQFICHVSRNWQAVILRVNFIILITNFGSLYKTLQVQTVLDQSAVILYKTGWTTILEQIILKSAFNTTTK